MVSRTSKLSKSSIPWTRSFASICTLSTCLAAGQANTAPSMQTGTAPDAPTPSAADTSPDLAHLLRNLYEPFHARPLPPITTDDPQSLTALMDKKGDIRLSAQQAISLAIANNLDVASVKLLKPIAETDLRRAKAGQLLRNVPTSTNSAPVSAPGPLPAASSAGYEGVANGQQGILSDLSVQLAGSQIPRLDPVLYANGSYDQSNLPEANSIITGTNVLASQTKQWQIGYQEGFLLGTTLDAALSSSRVSQNAPNNGINPATTADVTIRLTQPLLQGFGTKVNSRVIHIAKNNDRISSFTLREQLTLTITQVLTLYYDLATFRKELVVAENAAEAARKMLADNKKRLDLGLISQDEFIESEAELDADEQTSFDAQTQVEEQEATLKTVLTRAGLQNPAILAAHILPTDEVELPTGDESQPPVAALADRAVHRRLEVERSHIEIDNSYLSMIGTRDAVRPTLNVYGMVKTNGLAGQQNIYGGAGAAAIPTTFLGGYGQAFGQVAKGTYPDYEFGFNLNVPLTNAAAKADYDRAQLALQQQRIQTQQLENAVRLQAIKSALALQQARRQYETTVKNLKIRRDGLQAEQKMFELGTSTVGRLIGARHQLDFALRQEITGRNTYVRALINLDSVENDTLEKNHVILDENHPPSQAEDHLTPTQPSTGDGI